MRDSLQANARLWWCSSVMTQFGSVCEMARHRCSYESLPFLSVEYLVLKRTSAPGDWNHSLSMKAGLPVIFYSGFIRRCEDWPWNGWVDHDWSFNRPVRNRQEHLRSCLFLFFTLSCRSSPFVYFQPNNTASLTCVWLSESLPNHRHIRYPTRSTNTYFNTSDITRMC